MRPPEKRWYTPLLKHPRGTSVFIHEIFPDAHFFVEKIERKQGKVIRHVRFELNGKVILRGRSEIDLVRTHPKLAAALQKKDHPLGLLIEKYRVHRTRVRATTRTREFHFNGDLRAKLFERFYALPLVHPSPHPLTKNTTNG